MLFKFVRLMSLSKNERVDLLTSSHINLNNVSYSASNHQIWLDCVKESICKLLVSMSVPNENVVLQSKLTL